MGGPGPPGREGAGATASLSATLMEVLVTPSLRTSNDDRRRWQQATLHKLDAILEEHGPDLPPLVWTVGHGGLVGLVNGDLSAKEARATFDAWAQALGWRVSEPAAIGPGHIALRAHTREDQIDLWLQADLLFDPTP